MAKYLLLCTAALASFCYGLKDQAVLDSPTTTCTGKKSFPSGFTDENTPGNSVKVGDDTRYFGVYVPGTYDHTKQSKVIFDFHGAHGSPSGQYHNSRYYLNTVGQEYLVIYPLGSYDNTWQGAPDNYADDFAFVKALLSQINDTYCIDSTRVFASGKSQGGGFVDQLACSGLGDNFAAFAMASPALYQHWDQSLCADTKPRKILEAHGAIDHTIPYAGCLDSDGCSRNNGGQLPPISDWTWWWAETDGYGARQYINTSKRRYDNITYSGDSDGGVVKQYYIQNNGHCWPQAAGPPWNTDYTKSMTTSPDLRCHSTALDFTEVVVEFFEAAVSANMHDDRFTDEL